jgi:hypothetical protein
MEIYILTHEVNEQDCPTTSFDIICAYESRENAFEALIETACSTERGENAHFLGLNPKRIPSSLGFGLTYEWEDDGRIYYTHYKIKEINLL